MDYSKFLGTWVNTFREGHTIDQFILFEENGVLMMDTTTTGPIKNWGKTSAYAFGTQNAPDKPAAFEVAYDLGSSEHRLCINDSKGLLVASCFHRTKDNSGLESFFTREFFYKT